MAARPLVALLARTRPPGTTMPDEALCPAMPVLAIEPLRLNARRPKSMPLTTGATPWMSAFGAL